MCARRYYICVLEGVVCLLEGLNISAGGIIYVQKLLYIINKYINGLFAHNDAT